MNSICRFCGQLVYIDDSNMNLSEEEQIAVASSECDCPKAKEFREVIKNINNAKQKVDEIFEAVDVNHNITGLDVNTVEKFKDNMNLLCEGKVKTVSFEFSEKVGTLTATITAIGQVTVERKLTIKEKV